MTPIVFLYESEIKSAFNGSSTNSVQGYGFSLDKDSVFHINVKYPTFTPSGIPIPCRLHFIRTEKIVEEYLPTPSDPSKLILGFINTDPGRSKVFLIANGKTIQCEVKLLPEFSDLYSRSRGLLETDVLSKKTVGIVGLGSGGSPVALELAKAGVGKFVLIDFDRLELSNISRHTCGINDLGRLKTNAVKDAILQKNPFAQIDTLEIDVNEHRELCTEALKKVDLIVCASDNDQSRFLLNEISLKFKIVAIFGRAITRAIGGDVLRVRPHEGPCYSCLYSQNIRTEGSDDEEISQVKQAEKLTPDYTSTNEVKALVQVGLASDIAPISNFMVKLALVELSRGLSSGIKSLEDDLVSDFYIWANRRENVYESWSKLEYNFNKPAILRWYGARVKKDPDCMVCGF